MHFKHVFWSILLKSTYFPSGFIDLNVSKAKVIAIPVAQGSKSTLFTFVIPIILIAFNTSEVANLSIRDDPIALGWSAFISPDLDKFTQIKGFTFQCHVLNYNSFLEQGLSIFFLLFPRLLSFLPDYYCSLLEIVLKMNTYPWVITYSKDIW